MPHLIILRDEVSVGLYSPSSQTACSVQREDIDPGTSSLWLGSYLILCYDTAKWSHVGLCWLTTSLMNCCGDVFITSPIDLTHRDALSFDRMIMQLSFSSSTETLSSSLRREKQLKSPHMIRARNITKALLLVGSVTCPNKQWNCRNVHICLLLNSGESGYRKQEPS